MTSSGDFATYYKTISNAALLDILDNRQNYQDLAVEAAENEWRSRQLSDAEINEAKESLAEKQWQEQQKKDKAKETSDKIKNAGAAFVEIINPIQAEKPTTGKIITLISLAYAGIFLFELVSGFRHIIGSFRDIPGYPMVIIHYLGPLFLTPVAVYCFYKRKTAGWVLLAILVTFFGVVALWMLIEALTWKPSNIGVFNTIFRRPPPTIYIIQLLFLAGTLYLLCKTSIRELFTISVKKAVATLIITVFSTLFLLLIG